VAEAGGFVSSYYVYVFGSDFQVRHSARLSGLPSRARVSPDGRYGATTAFVTGHSYAQGGFSTQTLIFDMSSGARLGDLEELRVFRDGRAFRAVDFNFWGVTFTQDSDRFYATLATRGETYLVEGSVSAREMRVVRTNVECPSLSPDGTRLAFKKRMSQGLGGVTWRFHVLELGTMTETSLSESRSIDDQIEWLDDSQVLYSVGQDLWVMPADGSGEPRNLMSGAISPAVVTRPDEPFQSASGTLALAPTDVGVTISAAPDPVEVGEELTYMVTVTNHGPAEATEVGLDIRLPETATYLALGPVGPRSISYGCPLQGGYLSCALERLPSDTSWTLYFQMRPTVPGPLQNTVSVRRAQPDPVAENDAASSETTVTSER